MSKDINIKIEDEKIIFMLGEEKRVLCEYEYYTIPTLNEFGKI